MSVLARLWDRVSGSQPLPPAWVIGLTGLIALGVVLNSQSWRLAGKVITIAHEGGHALVSVLSGRRLDGITAPVDSGFSIQERMNCTSSSRRRLFFSTRATECDGIATRSRVHGGGPRRNINGYRARGRGSRWVNPIGCRGFQDHQETL